jgi:hypothetical protein
MAAQLVASRAVLSSTELVNLAKLISGDPAEIRSEHLRNISL